MNEEIEAEKMKRNSEIEYESISNTLDMFELDALKTKNQRLQNRNQKTQYKTENCICKYPRKYKNIWLCKPTDGKQGKVKLKLI